MAALTDGLLTVVDVSTAIVAGVAATGTLDLGDANADVLITADAAGAAGNAIQVSVVNPMEASHALTVRCTGKAIYVELATNAAGAPTSTGAQITTAINGNTAAAALVTASNVGTGASTAAPAAVTLSGGITACTVLAGEKIKIESITINGADYDVVWRRVDGDRPFLSPSSEAYTTTMTAVINACTA